MYTDVHCHLLPGVDDGAKSWAESEECLRIAQAERVTRLALTPHIWPDRYPNRPDDLREVFRDFQRRAQPLGLECHLGCEAYFHLDLPEWYRAGKLLAMGEAGRYLLVELPLTLCPPGLLQTFYALRLAGAEPVLAHPERYPYVSRDPRRLEDLGATGVPFQVTTHSLAGLFGGAVQRAAFALMERGWVRLLASDAHSSRGRVPMFRAAVRVVAARYGKEAARRLCVENPRRLLEGAPLLPVPCLRPGRRRA